MYRLSDKTAAIKEVQRFLFVISDRVNEEVPRVAIDGIYGNETSEAVAYFQKIYGLLADGNVNRETFDLLFFLYDEAMNQLQLHNYIITDEGFPLTIGMQNHDVMVLNLILTELRYTYPDISHVEKINYFSKSTQNAIMDLQKIFGEEESGIVDEIFYKRLKDELNSTHMLKKDY